MDPLTTFLAEASDESKLLAAYVFFLSPGVVLLLTLTIRFPRLLVFGATTGIVTRFLLATAMEGDSIGQALSPREWLLLAASGAAWGAGATVVVAALLRLIARNEALREFINETRIAVSPSLWEQGCEDEPPPRAAARRWFVAIGAATGCVTGSLLTFPQFWTALAASLTPGALLGALLVTGVSIVLVGPMQAYVMGPARKTSGSDPAEPAAATLERLMSWRSAVRLLLVFGLLLCLELLFNCLDESIRTASVEAALTVVITALTPGVVSYYWSAWLQHDGSLRSLPDPARGAAVACGAVLYYGWAFTMAFGLLYLLVRSPEPDPRSFIVFIFAPFLAVIPAYLLSLVTIGIPAAAGAWALERFRGGYALAMLGMAIALSYLLTAGVVEGILWWFTREADWQGFLQLLAGVAGWMVGLVASGFPAIVRRAGMRPAAAAAASGIPPAGAPPA